MLKSWLRTDIQSLKLIYRATRDSGKAPNFHKLVDGNKPLLLLIKFEKLGTIGVYTSIALRSGQGECDLDKEVFHFNLNKGIKYFPKDYTVNNVSSNSTYLGSFGKDYYSEIVIYDNCLNREDVWYSPGCCGFIMQTHYEDGKTIEKEEYCDQDNEQYLYRFKVLEYDVYQIII